MMVSGHFVASDARQAGSCSGLLVTSTLGCRISNRSAACSTLEHRHTGTVARGHFGEIRLGLAATTPCVIGGPPLPLHNPVYCGRLDPAHGAARRGPRGLARRPRRDLPIRRPDRGARLALADGRRLATPKNPVGGTGFWGVDDQARGKCDRSPRAGKHRLDPLRPPPGVRCRNCRSMCFSWMPGQSRGSGLRRKHRGGRARILSHDRGLLRAGRRGARGRRADPVPCPRYPTTRSVFCLSGHAATS
jgi:hypothetical protein